MSSSDISVKLLGYYGTDKGIAHRAWVSTDKCKDRTIEDEQRVIKMLVDKGHTSPLEIVSFDFELQVPIFIDRQIMTHRMRSACVGMSGRYCSLSDMDVYTPDDLNDLDIGFGISEYWDAVCAGRLAYTNLYEGVCEIRPEMRRRAREILRNVLPQSQMTTRRIQMNLVSLCNFLRQRLDKHAQKEIRVVAIKMLHAMRDAGNIPYTLPLLEQCNFMLERAPEIDWEEING